ncbi:MAG: CDP-diacylglycerol--serine O-phosphatidyltransferase [Alteromonadaceae bacterium]|nr:MAG: CDP-diacylglycerol--serine O-phosphatidyltransferase [Alteromonadaceae bacterium]
MTEDRSNSKPGDDSELSIDVPGGVPVDEHVEEVSQNGKKITLKGVYLLPNLFTTGALFGGFFAIVSAMDGNYANAALAIFAAQILDGFDGRVARMTNTQSAFGMEYDSLSDMVSFGLAPAIATYSWALQPLGKFGMAAAFVFATCAALRLARFNSQVESADSQFFTGLASPPAATLVASGVWLGSEQQLTTEISIFAAVLVTFVGFMMVSNVRYQSFKGLDKNRRVPFVAMLVTLLVFIAVIIDPPRVLFALAFVYALSGPAWWLWEKVSRK